LDRLNIPRSVLEHKLALGAPPEAVKICLQLLETVACPLALNELPTPRAPSLRQGLAWALECQQRLWRVIFEWLEAAETLQEDVHPAIGLFLDFTVLSRKCYTYSLKLSQGFSLDKRAKHVWLQSGVDMLASDKLQQSTDVQHIFSQLLNDAIHSSFGSPDIGAFIEDRFFRPLLHLSRNEASFQLFHPSFQVGSH
jgi:serine/threonine-protein kinase ATR